MTLETFQKCFGERLGGLGIKTPEEATSALQDRFAIVAESVQTGEDFASAVRLLVAKHKPDLVWLDPLLSFIGDDISKQDVCSYFLRNLLNSIAHETGVVWMMMHHTPKPSSDPKSKSGWNTTDMSYSGTGSSELTNWARAVCVLQSLRDEGRFALRLAKRSNRAGATDFDGGRTNLIHLKHADDSILWEATPPMFSVDKKKSGRKKPPAEKELNDLDGLIEKVVHPMKKVEIVNLSIEGGHGSYYLARKLWSQIEARLVKLENDLFQKPQNPEK